jgi:hypothetical protein
MAGLALVVATEDRAHELLLVAILAAGHGFERFGVRGMTLAAALHRREFWLAVPLLVVLVAGRAGTHRELWLSVHYMAVAAIHFAMRFDCHVPSLLLRVTALAVCLVGHSTGGEVMTLGAWQLRAVQRHFVAWVTGNAALGRGFLEGGGTAIVTLHASERGGAREMRRVQGVVKNIRSRARGILCRRQGDALDRIGATAGQEGQRKQDCECED